MVCDKERVIAELYEVMVGRGYRCERFVPGTVKCYRGSVEIVFFIVCHEGGRDG